MNILVTGGTGFLGRHLVRALLQHGHNVFCMGRNFRYAPVQDLLNAGAQPVHADLRVADAVIAACERMDAVYHVGALSAPWGPRRDFYDSNVGGTEVVIAGCRRYGVRRLIYVSSPSVVFNGHDQDLISESARYPLHFTSLYSRTKKLGEDRVNAVRELETVIMRPKAIFGPGDQTLLPRLLDVAKQKRLPQIGDGLNLVVGPPRLVAGALAAAHAILALLIVLPLQLAERLFPLAQLAAALLVRFGLAGGREIDPLADDLDRRGNDIDSRPRQTAAQRQREQNG